MLRDRTAERDHALDLLARAVSPRTLAAICDDLTCTDENERLTEAEAKYASDILFDAMMQGGGHEAVEKYIFDEDSAAFRSTVP